MKFKLILNQYVLVVIKPVIEPELLHDDLAFICLGFLPTFEDAQAYKNDTRSMFNKDTEGRHRCTSRSTQRIQR